MVMVTASAATVCTYSLTGTSSLQASGSSGSIMMTTQMGCLWSASSDSPWLNISGGATGEGPGTIGYTYDSNTGPSRQGHITAGGQTFTLTQASGQPDTPDIQSFIANPSSIDYGETSTLSWSIAGARSAAIDQRIGSVNATSASSSIRPGVTTTYTLTAQNDAGSQMASATVTVSNQPPSGLKIIAAFPNPVLSTDPASATTKISWSAPSQVKNVEIHVNAPNGPTAGAGGASGSFQTAPGIADPTIYFLQDVDLRQAADHLKHSRHCCGTRCRSGHYGIRCLSFVPAAQQKHGNIALDVERTGCHKGTNLGRISAQTNE